MTAPDARAARAAGFSLAEVVVALGLLASILISVAGLLVVGNRQVTRGRDSSKALAVARDVLEEMKSWSFERTTGAFAGVSSCVSATSCSVDSDDIAAVPDLAQWKQEAETLLAQGIVLILLESLDGALLPEARAVRVTVVLEWMDGVNPRSLRLATVRM